MMEAAPDFIESIDLPPCSAFYSDEVSACELWIDESEDGAAELNENECRICKSSSRVGMETYGSQNVAIDLAGIDNDLAVCVQTLGQLNVGLSIGPERFDWIEFLGVRSLKAAQIKKEKKKLEEDK